MRILGLDEAGRGCVLGPLVIGAFCCEAEHSDALRAAGADDSKAIRAKLRPAVREKLRPLGVHEVREVSARQIDAGNINTLEEACFVDLIVAHAPDHVFIDAPVHPRGIPKLLARIQASVGERLGRVPQFTVEPKADVTYAVVGAASIFAKVHRDARIHALDAAHGPIGSGYPSDPVTRRWLQARMAEPGPLPAFIRTRWQTLENLRQQSMFPQGSDA